MGNDKLVVSSLFDLIGFPGRFKILLHAKVTSDRWGGSTFRNSKGKGIISLKCIDPSLARNHPMRFEVSIVEQGQGLTHKLASQDVTHNFSEQGVCEVTNNDKGWDFK